MADIMNKFENIRVRSVVGENSNVDPEDTLNVKNILIKTGDYTVPRYGLTSIPDSTMIKGIKQFQQRNGLRVDGVIKPQGATEQALNNTIGKKSESAKPTCKSEGECAVLHSVCIPFTNICYKRWKCVDCRPWGGGIRG